jgi:hypothetical protein
MARILSVLVGFALIISISAKVCGKEHEDSWDGPCKNGKPEGKGTYTHASAVMMFHANE